MNRTLVLAAVAAALSGCTTIGKQPLSEAALSELRGQPVAQTTRKLPDFAAMTPTKAAFGMLGAVATISAGNAIIAENRISDPADAVAAGLASALAGRYAAKVVASPIAVSSDDAGQVAAATDGSARFVVDVQTINWSFVYFPTDWTHYRVIYTAKARLIDTQSKSVVAEGFCKRIPESNVDAPTYDDLVSNQAAGLKAQLASAADECLKTLKAEMLRI